MANEISGGVGAGVGKVSVVSDNATSTTPYPVAAEVFRWGAGVTDLSGQSTSGFAPSPGMVRADQSYQVGPNGGVPKPPTGVGYSPGDYMAEFQKNFPEEYKKMQEAQAQQALLAKPPSFDEMSSMLDEKNLVDGKLSEVSASRMLNASREDKLKMLESWGMKPKHTNKDPAQVEALFAQVVSEMRQGPHAPKDYRVRFAGKKFRLHIKRDPVTGKLTAAFKRKKPKWWKKILKTVVKVVGYVAMAAATVVTGGAAAAALAAVRVATAAYSAYQAIKSGNILGAIGAVAGGVWGGVSGALSSAGNAIASGASSVANSLGGGLSSLASSVGSSNIISATVSRGLDLAGRGLQNAGDWIRPAAETLRAGNAVLNAGREVKNTVDELSGNTPGERAERDSRQAQTEAWTRAQEQEAKNKAEYEKYMAEMYGGQVPNSEAAPKRA